MNVEINDPVLCTIINQAGDSKLPPVQGKARVCGQCERETWRSTAICIWCGHDRWITLKRLAGGSAAATVMGLLFLQLQIFH